MFQSNLGATTYQCGLWVWDNGQFGAACTSAQSAALHLRAERDAAYADLKIIHEALGAIGENPADTVRELVEQRDSLAAEVQAAHDALEAADIPRMILVERINALRQQRNASDQDRIALSANLAAECKHSDQLSERYDALAAQLAALAEAGQPWMEWANTHWSQVDPHFNPMYRALANPPEAARQLIERLEKAEQDAAQWTGRVQAFEIRYSEMSKALAARDAANAEFQNPVDDETLFAQWALNASERTKFSMLPDVSARTGLSEGGAEDRARVRSLKCPFDVVQLLRPLLFSAEADRGAVEAVEFG